MATGRSFGPISATSPASDRHTMSEQTKSRVRAILAEPAYRGHRQARIDGTERRMRERPLRHDRGRSCIEQHVGVGQHRAEPFEIRGVGGIGGDAPLAGIQPGEIRAFRGTVGERQRGWFATAGITARRFDLQHLGAEIGKQLAAICQGGTSTQLDDTIGREHTRTWQTGRLRRCYARSEMPVSICCTLLLPGSCVLLRRTL